MWSESDFPTRRKLNASLSGFTLVELLVVVAIISLLLSILLPAMDKARQIAMGVKCLSNHRQLVTGTLYYLDDNRMFFPRVSRTRSKQSFGDHFSSGASGNATVPWYGEPYVGQYIGNEHICATAAGPKYQKPSTEIVYCPQRLRDGPEHNLDIGLGMNNSRQNYFNNSPHNEPEKFIALTQFRRPGLTFILADTDSNTDPTKNAQNFAWNRYYPEQKNWPVTGNDNEGTGYTDYRHGENTSVVFADGHADSFSDMETARDNKQLTHKAK